MLSLNNKQRIIVVSFMVMILGFLSYKSHMKEKKEIHILSDTNYEIQEENEENLTVQETFPSFIVVHVEGEVNRPGIYELPEDSRVFDVIEMAGGLKSTAARKKINLAKKIFDEEFIYIPSEEDEDYRVIEANASISTSNKNEGLININQADKSQLETLPGIGPKLAERIIAYRNENGFFETPEDIQKVSGIGEKKFNDLKDKIIVK